MRLRSLFDVELPQADQLPDGAVLLYDRARGRWVARVLDTGGEVPPHTHPPVEITPQGSGSGLDADTVDGKHAAEFALASHTHPNATTTDSGFMSAEDKAKLDGIQPGAEVNQNAFSGVKVGATTVTASSPTDTLELVAGSGVTLTPDTATKTITIALNPTYYDSGTVADTEINSTNGITITSLSIPAGVYLVIGTSAFTASSTTSAILTFYLQLGSTVLASASAGGWNSSYGPLSLTIPYIGALDGGTLSIGAKTAVASRNFTARSARLIALRIA